MTSLKKPQVTIDSLLTTFFDHQREQCSGVRRSRITLIEKLLRECLEQEGERFLVGRDQVVLAAEREFHAVGAFARTMHADDLIYVLPLFLQDERLQENPLVRRLQLQLTDALTGHIIYGGYALYDDLVCQLYEIRGGIDRAKWVLNTVAREKQREKRLAASLARQLDIRPA
jgi:hypothetical protein